MWNSALTWRLCALARDKLFLLPSRKRNTENLPRKAAISRKKGIYFFIVSYRVFLWLKSL
jgi:hypothetical protein